MEKNAGSGVVYYLAVERHGQEYLARIRHWSNLKLAFTDDHIWIRGFDEGQVQSVEVKSLPDAQVYYEQDSQLFRIKSRLPDRPVPAALWTPIDRALTVTLPAFNHNYFGIHDEIPIRLVAQEQEMDAVAMITTLENLQHYIIKAPAVRLQQLHWCLMDQHDVLLLGRPLLPITGQVYWEHNGMLLPAGWNFEFPIAAEAIRSRVASGNEYIIWNSDASWFSVSRGVLMPLSRSSFRKTYDTISDTL